MAEKSVKKFYTKIKTLFEKYERVLLPATLVLGIVVDSFTFASIDIVWAFLILGLHILFSGTAIAFLNIFESGVFGKNNRVAGIICVLCPLVVQFSFGALLSACFIFYFFSGSFYTSWPFILLIVILMISNDVFRKYYLRPQIQIAVYFFLLFSIFGIIFPYIFKALDPWIFILAGGAALIFIFCYILFLSRFADRERFSPARFWRPILFVLASLIFLYFSNIVPPVPLALKDAAVGHGITVSAGTYNILMEGESFLDKVLPGRIVHKTQDGLVAVYTAIFAPGELTTKIFHHWQHKEDGKWISKGRFSFGIAGGKKTGYRGYSVKSVVPAGNWRVFVETERGQVLGRVRFDVVETETPPKLIEVKK